MRKLIAILAIAGLSGCVAYGVPYGSAQVYYSDSPYYGAAPYYGSPSYHGAPYYGRGGYRHDPRFRDRDRDGIADRYDRDRDGDGVPNWRDSYPNDPRRR